MLFDAERRKYIVISTLLVAFLLLTTVLCCQKVHLAPHAEHVTLWLGVPEGREYEVSACLRTKERF